MLRLSLRRWCAAAATTAASTTTTAHSTTASPSSNTGASSLPDFYGKSFTVAPRTWEQINRKNAEEGFANDARFLRLAIDSGGCHGYLYKFSFEPSTQVNQDEDVVIAEADAVPSSEETFTGAQPSPRIVVDTLSASKLENATLDFHSELKGSAFVVVGNELVDQSCACAMSFSLKKKTAKGPSSAKGASSSSAGKPSGAPQASSASASTSGSNARPITRRSSARSAAS